MRPQFSLKTLLWLMVGVAAFLGGRALGIRQERQSRIDDLVNEQEQLRDSLAKERASFRLLVQEHQKWAQQFQELTKTQKQLSQPRQEPLRASQAPQ